MNYLQLLGIQSDLSPELESEFLERTNHWINRTFRLGLFVISAVMWTICLFYMSIGFDAVLLKLAIGGQCLFAYAYFTTMFSGSARKVINRLSVIFPIAYVYGFMGYYVPQLSSDALVFQSQAWIIWVIMLIYAIERISPLLALGSATATSVLYFYLRFKIPQFQELPYFQIAAQVAAANLTGFFICIDHTARSRRQFKLEKELEAERMASEKLLRNVLPVSIVAELKSQVDTIAHTYENVTVLFADLVDFTKTAAAMKPQILVKMLDELFSRFDALADQHGIEKIKTIGDAYMAAAGCPEVDPQHAVRMAHFALQIDGVIRRFNADFGTEFKIKVGLSSGAVMGGVIGKKRISFDLWGDVVNLASRIESVAGGGEVLISEGTAELIGTTFLLSSSRVVDLKGKGPTMVYSIVGSRPEDSKQGLDPDNQLAYSSTKQKTEIAAPALQ